jgi:hypothetical protein
MTIIPMRMGKCSGCVGLARDEKTPFNVLDQYLNGMFGSFGFEGKIAERFLASAERSAIYF